MGLSENVVYPEKPNGFADHYPVFKNGYFIGNIPNIFRQTHVLRVNTHCLTKLEWINITSIAPLQYQQTNSYGTSIMKVDIISKENKPCTTVNGRNPAPVDRWFIPLIVGF